MPVRYFLQQGFHHLGLKSGLLLLLFSKNGSEKVSGCDLFAHGLNISGDQAATCDTRCCNMTQTHAGLRREGGFEMDNSPCTDPRIMPNDRTLKNHNPCCQIAIATNLASH